MSYGSGTTHGPIGGAPYAELFLAGVFDFLWDIALIAVVMVFVSIPVLGPPALLYVAWQYFAYPRRTGGLVEPSSTKTFMANAVDP
jgi:hypothetical protein